MGRNGRNKGGKGRLAALFKEADRLFSILVRMKTLQYNGRVECYTCGKSYHFKQMQCGHYISRGCIITRWLEENCRPQCNDCNCFKGEEKHKEFGRRLELDHPGLPEQLKQLEWGPAANYTKSDLEDHIKLIKKRIEVFGGLKCVPGNF